MAATNNQDVIVIGDDLHLLLQEFEGGLSFTQLAVDVQEERQEIVQVNPPAENNTPVAIGAGVDTRQASTSRALATEK
ncbi:unnamed protein product [Callosobruchus maculatus]|uniref:Uncharacterized protein n=1 Tax=Callosobruchus maculatus TaxID=64391 RepID=A0A653D1F6_CALMS|nr:unnamed protein product [Callosobruchus maculatus]